MTTIKNKILPYILSGAFFFSPLPAVQDSFESDIHQLAIFEGALREMFEEMVSLHDNTSRLDKEYISNIENDQIENLLFRYLILRQSLWEVIGKYRDYNTLTDDPETNMKAFVIGYYAALTLYKASGHLITINMKDDLLVDKLNESYFRSGIPKNTFEKIFDSLTNPENLEELDIAWELYTRELHLSGSPLNQLLSDPLYVPLINELEELQTFHVNHREEILNHYVLLTPEITNLLRHSDIKKQAKYLIEESGGQYEALKAFLLTWVGDIKSPVTDNLYFTSMEKNEIKQMLRPGDIILTYSAGYMSNIFLPGTFKHGIVYVGDRQSWNEQDWASLHLSAEKRAFIHPGDDIIESVSEGVISNSMDHLLDHKVNRMVILRPKLNPAQIQKAMGVVHSYLGNGYDFSFDFNDAATQVCTEIIYRAFNGVGGIEFHLRKRVGNMTLSADDICINALETSQMDVIALIVEDEFRPNRARLLTDHTNREILKKLLE